MTGRARRQFRYPMRALLLDYAGSAAGLSVFLGPLAFMQPAVPVAWALAVAAVLFLVYFGRTVCRQLTHVELDEAGIRAVGPGLAPLSVAIRWDDLRSLRLDYYSTRRDREGGWMQLKLRDAQRTIRIDSDLEGFAELVGRAADEAARRGLAPDPTSAANLDVLKR